MKKSASRTLPNNSKKKDYYNYLLQKSAFYCNDRYLDFWDANHNLHISAIT